MINHWRYPLLFPIDSTSILFFLLGYLVSYWAASTSKSCPVEAVLGGTTRVKFTIGHTVLVLYNFTPRYPSDILTQLFEINAIIATITNFLGKPCLFKSIHNQFFMDFVFLLFSVACLYISSMTENSWILRWIWHNSRGWVSYPTYIGPRRLHSYYILNYTNAWPTSSRFGHKT